MELEIAAKRLDALGNPSRLAIFRHLVRAGAPGLSVGEVAERIGIANSTLSHHLHRLVAVGLVAQRREGTSLICSVSYAAMNETMEFLLRECCAEAGASHLAHPQPAINHDLAGAGSAPLTGSHILEETAS